MPLTACLGQRWMIGIALVLGFPLSFISVTAQTLEVSSFPSPVRVYFHRFYEDVYNNGAATSAYTEDRNTNWYPGFNVAGIPLLRQQGQWIPAAKTRVGGFIGMAI